MNITIDINGKDVTASIEPRVTLLDFIRDVAGPGNIPYEI